MSLGLFGQIGPIGTMFEIHHQADPLLPQSIEEIFEEWSRDSCPAMKLNIACDRNFDFDHPKTTGGLKMTGFEKGVVF